MTGDQMWFWFVALPFGLFAWALALSLCGAVISGVITLFMEWKDGIQYQHQRNRND